MEIHLNRVDYIQVSPVSMFETDSNCGTFHELFRLFSCSNLFSFVHFCFNRVFCAALCSQVGVTSQKTMRLLPALGKKTTQKVF